MQKNIASEEFISIPFSLFFV